jgi:hypothetical protein
MSLEPPLEATLQEARQELLMEATGLDGHLVTTHRFVSSRPPEAFVESIKANWEREGLKVVQTSRGPWQLLSVRRDSVFETLQLRTGSDGGSEGLHSVWRRDPASAAAGAERQRRAMHAELRTWLPESVVPIRELMQAGAGQTVATLVATAVEAEATVVAAITRRLQAAGFAPAAMPGAPGGAAPVAGSAMRRQGAALAYRRGAEEVVATVAAHRGETAVVVHWSRPQ